MSTAKSGYIQRRIVKVCEDMQIRYDGTVRDSVGKIYQLAYGENGWDATHMVKVGNQKEICNVSRIVTQLNAEHEYKKTMKKTKC